MFHDACVRARAHSPVADRAILLKWFLLFRWVWVTCATQRSEWQWDGRIFIYTFYDLLPSSFLESHQNINESIYFIYVFSTFLHSFSGMKCESKIMLCIKQYYARTSEWSRLEALYFFGRWIFALVFLSIYKLTLANDEIRHLWALCVESTSVCWWEQRTKRKYANWRRLCATKIWKMIRSKFFSSVLFCFSSMPNEKLRRKNMYSTVPLPFVSIHSLEISPFFPHLSLSLGVCVRASDGGNYVHTTIRECISRQNNYMPFCCHALFIFHDVKANRIQTHRRSDNGNISTVDSFSSPFKLWKRNFPEIIDK